MLLTEQGALRRHREKKEKKDRDSAGVLVLCRRVVAMPIQELPNDAAHALLGDLGRGLMNGGHQALQLAPVAQFDPQLRRLPVATPAGHEGTPPGW
jgi:hypothetical protein